MTSFRRSCVSFPFPRSLVSSLCVYHHTAACHNLVGAHLELALYETPFSVFVARLRARRVIIVHRAAYTPKVLEPLRPRPPVPTPDLPLYSSLTFPFLAPFPEPIPVDVVQGMHTAKFGPGGASADSAPAIAPAASHSPTSMTVTKDEEDKLQKISIGDELNVRRRGGGGDAGTRMEEGI